MLSPALLTVSKSPLVHSSDLTFRLQEPTTYILALLTVQSEHVHQSRRKTEGNGEKWSWREVVGGDRKTLRSSCRKC